MAKKEKKVEAIALDEQLTKSEAFIEKNLKTILIIIAAVIVVVAGVFIYRNHMANVELEAQNAIAKSVGYMGSYWLVVAMLAYILFYATVGCKNVNKDIPVE